jgi:murein DD-endopeptidase MepM/ murein hydrolase activator NlpD
MVADTSGRGGRLLPDIRVQFGALQVWLPPAVQLAVAASVITFTIALGYLGMERIGRDRVLADKDAAMLRTETANADLHDQLASLKEKLALASHARDQAEARLSAVLASQAQERLAGADGDRAEPLTAHDPYLRPQGAMGQFRLTGVITPDLAQDASETTEPLTLITDAPPATEGETRSVADIGRRAVTEFRRLLASTGLNIERLFPQFDTKRAEGGPFVAPSKADHADGINQDQLEAMRSLMRSLPLSVPLDQYQLESRFGPRRDPFNRRPSFHTGIDLSAPYMSPVYATAGGVVTYAGWRSEYGKVVEIAHGNGIVTLYGHLHRSVVSIGQTVAEHTQIGFLGSTGRSSGPHVHYEIQVNDEPQDPEKFIGLARLIPATAAGR